jgi:hypothetical protein
MAGFLEYVDDNREKLKLVGYFVLTLALALPLARMLGEAYREANLVESLLRLRLLAGVSLETVSLAVFGVYLGLLVLMAIDPKKRWQGFLMWLGTVVGLLALQSMGLFLPNVDLVGGFPVVLGGAVVGLVLGGGRRLLDLREARAVEFRMAPRILFFLLATFTVLGFLELHLSYPQIFEVTSDGVSVVLSGAPSLSLNTDGIAQNAVVTVLFVVTMRQFIRYDAEKRFFILGPRAAGKSLFLIGLYLEVLRQQTGEERSTPLNPSMDLMEMVEALDRQNSEWIVEATGRGELKYLEFTFVDGTIFPMNMELSAMDYAGEYLSRLPDALTGAISDDEMDNTLRRLSEGIEHADTLILTVDSERFVNNEPLDISEYFSILQAADDKDVIIVGTKADYFAEQFEEERGLEPHLYFEEFKEFVNRRLRQSENVDALVNQAGGTKIHPVYYQTTTDEAGNRVPMRDDTGSPMTVGFDEFLDEIGRS